METRRFRNHFSVILERIGSGVILLFFVVIGKADDIVADFSNADISVIPVLIGIGIFLLLIGTLFFWQFFVWKKTWIVLDADTISVEKNTIHSTKNTIGIKNISNVNTEQNIFEMMVGTCKVKLDTNSLSTANETDVKIVLKKADAEALRQTLVKRINELNTGTEFLGNVSVFDDENEKYDEEASMKDIILNGIYSSNILVVLWVVALVALLVLLIISCIKEGMDAEGISILMGIGFVAVSSIIGFLRSLLCMYGFKVKREDDRLYLKYGLFKKVDFAIPVDKINAIRIHQTMIARICRKYTVEMVNVGMGDEENSSAYFTFYASKEKTRKSIEKLLPEFAEAVETDFEKQPKQTWIVKAVGFLFGGEIMAAMAFMVQYYVEDISKELCIIVPFLILLLSFICQILSYTVTGISISQNCIGIQEGMFGTNKTFINFEKIQYITLKQNLLTKKLGILKGDVAILAMLGKGFYSIPYMKEERAGSIYKKLCSFE